MMTKVQLKAVPRSGAIFAITLLRQAFPSVQFDAGELHLAATFPDPTIIVTKHPYAWLASIRRFLGLS